MQLRPIDPDRPEDVRVFHDILNAVLAADTPWDHEALLEETEGMLRYGWDGDLPDRFLVDVGGESVGTGFYRVSPWDNPQLAWCNVRIHPDHRRRGHGSAVLEAMLERARTEGRRTLGTTTVETPENLAFAAKRGFELASREVVRRQVLAEVDWAVVEALHKEAADHAAGYRLERIVGPSNPEQLVEIAAITGAINDAPVDDLDFEAEVFPPERVARYEHAQAARGNLMHRLMARHLESGELAGQTVVAVRTARPTLGEQHDTSVMREHRGHRLGLYLKSAMMLWLRQTQPQLEIIDTGNAATNHHMIGINEQLGYRVMGFEAEVQRRV